MAVITLNSPESMNALESHLYEELESAVLDVASDDSIGAVILTGSGRSFCAGGDLNRFAEGFATAEEGCLYMKHFAPFVKAFALIIVLP